uniref:Uncharacterized protein n=1 Tax=viral metagenome TaxID=1070528 RepID=A0A6C0I5K4_9ZZZZ
MSLANYAEEYEALLNTRMKQGIEQVNADIEKYRAEQMVKIADELREAQKQQIAAELEAERNTSFTHLHQQIRSFMDELKLLEEHTKLRLTERISLHEKSETERLICEQKVRLAKEREESLRQYELLQAKSIADLDLEHKRLKEEKLSVLMIETELQRVKIRQTLEDQNQSAIYEFRMRLSDEYAHTEAAERKRNEDAIASLKLDHAKAASDANTDLLRRLQEEGEAQTKAHKAKLHDEFARLRHVEKMLLQDELANETRKYKESVKAEHAEFVRRLQESQEQQKRDYAALLNNEKIAMEADRIREHAVECEQFRLKTESEFEAIRVKSKQALDEEIRMIRGELLDNVLQEIDIYKAALIADSKKEVELIKQRELEEMRESLYVLAMERVREKMSGTSSI